MEKETTTEISENAQLATFAGGCFWCVESAFEDPEFQGIINVVSGFTGGDEVNPTYKEVSSGKTGHIESIQITYDPNLITYENLLQIFWRQINPTDNEGQFVDRGYQYTTAIFYHTEEQKILAEESKAALNVSGKYDTPLITPILPAKEFYVAEEYHQDYHTKNPIRYKTYRHLSGRDQYLKTIWTDDLIIEQVSLNTFSKPSDAELKETLTEIQYEVTQKEGTETPFDNEYWDNHEEGIYVDIISGEALFSSTDKYDSGTGWPSFYKPLAPENIVEKADYKLLTRRTEIRSKQSDSHIGHIILDGPEWNDKVRYCMNSAALRFIPKDHLEKEGYGEFLNLFE